MAKLIQRDGRYYKGDGDQFEELTGPQYQKEMVMQQMVQQQSFGEKAWTGAGKYISDLASGASQLMGGPENARAEQQSRADLQQQYGPHQDYGGAGPGTGEFLAGASTAAIPGGLPVQMGIGGIQGMLENPDSPVSGFGMGAGFTLAGDVAANSISRIGTTLSRKRKLLSTDADYRRTVAAGQAEGLQFTPGQIADDPARRTVENTLRKTPRFAAVDEARWLNNQGVLNDNAAKLIGEKPTGRITPPMRGRAVEKVGKAFDNVAENSSPVELLGKPWLDEVNNLTDPGKALHENFLNKFPDVFEGEPITGKQFVDARNWLAKQTRKTANWQSGAAEEMQPFLRIMDDSLEASNIESNPMLVDEIRKARQIWKANLVIEDSLRGATQSASGNLSAPGAYGALKKYDKGGIFRGRSRDPFNTVVDAMAATGDTAPQQMVSHDATRGLMGAVGDMVWSQPGAEQYMRGTKLGDLMMGVSAPNPQVLDYVRQLGQGGARGSMGLMDLLGSDDEGLME